MTNVTFGIERARDVFGLEPGGSPPAKVFQTFRLKREKGGLATFPHHSRNSPSFLLTSFTAVAPSELWAVAALTAIVGQLKKTKGRRNTSLSSHPSRDSA